MLSPARHALSCFSKVVLWASKGVVDYPHLAYLTSIGRLHGTHHGNLTVHATAAPWSGAHNAAFSLKLQNFQIVQLMSILFLFYAGADLGFDKGGCPIHLNRAPKAPRPRRQTGQRRRGVGNVEGVYPSPSDQRFWGSIVSSPSGVWGKAPAENEFRAF